MYTKITYICNKAIYCGFKPENVDIKEERIVLYAEEGYNLIRISDEENIGNAIWLKDGDTQNNYREEEEHQELEPL